MEVLAPMAAQDSMATPCNGDVTTVTCRMPIDLADRVAKLAERHDRTVDGEIRHALRAHLDRLGGGDSSKPVVRPSDEPDVLTVKAPAEHAVAFRHEVEATVRLAKQALAESLRLGDDHDVDRDRGRLDCARRLRSTVEQNLSFEVDSPEAWWTVREAVREGVWAAGHVLATESESEWPDFQAARKAHAELGFLWPLLERLDARVPGAFLVGEGA